MEKSLGIRLAPDEHRRIHAAAFSQGISVKAFVQKVVMAAVKELENHSNENAGRTDFVLVGVRNGPPGYRKRGRDFAKWLEKHARRAHRELLEMLQVVDAVMLERENFRPLYVWCQKHFPRLIERIPQRRRRLFAEGILEAVKR
jgi:hypothetical protein